MTRSAPWRAIFFGTPEFAVPSLAALCQVAEVVLVVTQPDRPSGRGLKLQAPPVKRLALERGIEVIQPRRGRGGGCVRQRHTGEGGVAVVGA
jgi:methionyl-tRNA formyltransferase